MENAAELEIEVVYALPDRQVVKRVTLAAGSRIREAIETSGLLVDFPEIRLSENTVGRFGEPADLDDRLQAGDRVEIYRPLRADPRETRRRRAAVRARTKR
jgi:putative ubiquitin-RnfH superfamily antitoxin RatB of RatAB toxin-antitoxin module